MSCEVGCESGFLTTNPHNDINMIKGIKALLIVDVQNDFCPDGALGVKNGDTIIPAINQYIKIFADKKFPIFATRDWHPRKTKHFKKYGGVWPRHCVAGTKGALFHSGLVLPKETIILSKGMNPLADGYSAFEATDQQDVGLLMLLKLLRVQELFISGLATDYCVKNSASDALKNGFKTYVLIDAIKGVNLKANDSKNAIIEMISKGASFVALKDMKTKRLF